MKRRHFLTIAAAAALSACATTRSAAPLPTRVRLSAKADGYSIYVDDELVDLAELGAVVLTRATAANPGLTADQVRTSVRLYLIADSGLQYRSVVEVMHQLQAAGFTQIAFVAEDRR